MKNFGDSSLDVDTFERRTTSLLKQILWGNQKLSAITSKDTFLMAHRTTLTELNAELEPSILTMIEDMSTYVYPADLAIFLIAAKSENLVNEAAEILDSVRQERRLMSLNDLTGALAETSSMPGSWAASLFGSLDAERDATPQVLEKKPTIDLASMHRGLKI